MTDARTPPPAADPAGDKALMARHGITRASVHHYSIDGYRYTSLGDALAQAKRSAGGGSPA